MQWSKEEEAAARKRVEDNSAVRVLVEEQGSPAARLFCLNFQWFISQPACFPSSLGQ